MPTPVVIRRAAASDIDALVALLNELFSIEEDFTPDESRQRRGLGLLLESPETRCALVAEADGQVAGMCTAQLVISTAEGGPSALVEDVVVTKAFRGKGIGKQLTAAIGAWAASVGCTRMQLLADQNNDPALRFYQKLGWTRTQLVCLRRTEFV